MPTDDSPKGDLCEYCREKADGPMLRLGTTLAHAPCVYWNLRQLLDPDWEPGRHPARLPDMFPRPPWFHGSIVRWGVR